VLIDDSDEQKFLFLFREFPHAILLLIQQPFRGGGINLSAETVNNFYR
jgi:hypothetical protein